MLVTGGAGFIGSSFSKKLVELGAEVIVYDNLGNGRYELIKELEGKKSFKFIKADLLNFETLDANFKKYKPQVVLHLAANSDVKNGLQDTRLDLEQGTLATYNVLEAARKNNVEDILFSSSSVVYGYSSVRPTPEDYGPLKPVSMYGASKLACEGMITAFSHLYGFNNYIYRFANIVGQNLTHGVILDFAKKLKKNSKELEVLGNGKQRKSYLDVMDCIDGMLLVYNKSNEKENIYNLSLDDQISVSEIAEMVIKELSPNARIRYTGTESGWPGDVPNSYLSNKRISSLGFKPRYKTSREAVLHAIECNKNILSHSQSPT